ncbi:SDR family oxidoreductase [Hoeflea sp. WL0058]|uniref:SDR family oxidoreductase n=1 Tax=Flavimaribacter sediminis TaxID=2865987 RepID=A0AAE2ZRW3_9HYPH|nr:SDR family oxidoreductase [Flavimaribacter sediminis]MBW8638417.1 SDR family oxidoreductase [Flavimaribacter sediminis]
MSAGRFQLDGMVAVITGSSRGIGRAIAETMADLGAKVVISSRNAEPCREVADKITGSGGTAIAQPCNISRKQDVEELISVTTRELGTPDILVCNAAVNPYFGPLEGIEDEAFDKIMSSNIKSNLWLCNRVAPGMKEKGGGAIVIISSIAGLRGTEVLGAYGISKAADFSLARNLAVEHGPDNIRVNCIAPGLVKTDFARKLWEDEKSLARRTQTTPLRRIGMPEEIGPIAAFLASPASSFITGQVIVADGGVTIA